MLKGSTRPSSVRPVTVTFRFAKYFSEMRKGCREFECVTINMMSTTRSDGDASSKPGSAGSMVNDSCSGTAPADVVVGLSSAFAEAASSFPVVSDGPAAAVPVADADRPFLSACCVCVDSAKADEPVFVEVVVVSGFSAGDVVSAGLAVVDRSSISMLLCTDSDC